MAVAMEAVMVTAIETGMDIDVHVLRHPDRPAWMLQQALSSLEHEPVTVHVLDAVVGHVGRARMAGFAQGEAEFVSFVDDDDAVDPGLFARARAVLAAQPQLAGVFFPERRIEAGEAGLMGPFTPANPWKVPYSPTALVACAGLFHHGLFRRYAVARHLGLMRDWSIYPEPVLFAAMAAHWPLAALEAGPHYLWRKHPGQVSLSPGHLQQLVAVQTHATGLLFAPRPCAKC